MLFKYDTHENIYELGKIYPLNYFVNVSDVGKM